MKIYALDSDNEDFQDLINQIAEKISIDLFDNFDEMLIEVEEDCGGILLDFDNDQRKKNKMISKLKKEFDGLNIFLLANTLNPKKISKHQNSKQGANLYFQQPIDDEMLVTMLEAFFDFEVENFSEQEVLADHMQVRELKGEAKELSDKLDQVFSGAFLNQVGVGGNVGQHSATNIDDGGLTLGVMEDIDSAEGVSGDDSSVDEMSLDDSPMDEMILDDSPMDEMSLDDSSMDEMSLDDSPIDEMSLDDSPIDEMSLDDSSMEEMSLDDSSVEEFSLDEIGDEEVVETKSETNSDDNWQDNEELSMSADDMEDDLPEKYPSEEDLTFPDFDGHEQLNASDDSQEAEPEAEEIVAKESGVEELDLGDSSEELLSLSEDGDLSESVTVEPDSLDLSLDEESTGEFDLRLSEETSASLNIDDSDNTSPSQVLDLGEDEVGLDISEADSTEPEDDLDTDLGLSLSSDDEKDSAGDMNTGVDVIKGLEDDLDLSFGGEKDEITRPIISGELDTELKAGKIVEDEDEDEDIADLEIKSSNTFEDPDALSVDDLLSSKPVENELPDELGLSELEQDIVAPVESEDIDDEMTIVGVAMVQEDQADEGAELENKLSEEDLFEGGEESIEEPTAQEVLHADQLSETNDEQENEIEEEATSIAINPDLSSVNLPDEIPEFSTTVAQKLDDIDTMLEDEVQNMNDAYEADDKTMIASHSEDATTFVNPANLQAETSSYDDSTVVQNIPDESQVEPVNSVAVNVSEELKQEHREYVKNHDEELIRLGETIKSLREDRDDLLEKVHQLESKKEAYDDDHIAIKAQLDEKRIEVAIVKKRMEKQIDDLRFQLDITLDKKEFLSKQNTELQRENEKLSKQNKLDVNKIRFRERELEEQLEMLRNDAEIQIKNRDKKILELKRKIDTLEFDIESAHMKEKKSVNSQVDLEEKMNRVIKTLRGAIGQLEDDYGAEERKSRIKKNLDI